MCIPCIQCSVDFYEGIPVHSVNTRKSNVNRIIFYVLFYFSFQTLKIVYNGSLFELKVRGQISLYRGSSIIFGLSDFPVSEFELVAEELLMSDSIIKVHHPVSLILLSVSF